jgi:hypothetical protein
VLVDFLNPNGGAGHDHVDCAISLIQPDRALPLPITLEGLIMKAGDLTNFGEAT